MLLAGVPCDFRLDYGRHMRRSATLIAANRSAREARLNRRPDVAAIGDAGDFLAASPRASRASARTRGHVARDACARATQRAKPRSTRGPGRRANASIRSRSCARSTPRRPTTRPSSPTAAISSRPPPTSCGRAGRARWLDPGAFGTLGVGAGFALAAALERPQAETWILLGDGACGWSLAEFDTFVRHGVPVIAVVGNDAGWTQIAREQVKMLGDDVGVTLSRSAYHEAAAAFGAEGVLIKSAGEIADGLARARTAARAGRPALVNVWLDRADFRDGSISM